MPGDLRFRIIRIGRMAKPNAADGDFGAMVATKISRGSRIVIARDPDPVASGLQRSQCSAVFRQKSASSTAVMERIAERQDALWRMARNHRGERSKSWKFLGWHSPPAAMGRSSHLVVGVGRVGIEPTTQGL